MNIKEVINELKTCYLIQSDDEGRRRNGAIEKAIYNLEFRDERKPYCKRQGTGMKVLHCPTCDAPIGINVTNFCSCCGQRLNKQEVEA